MCSCFSVHTQLTVTGVEPQLPVLASAPGIQRIVTDNHSESQQPSPFTMCTPCGACR
jgi:hypothetical protein